MKCSQVSSHLHPTSGLFKFKVVSFKRFESICKFVSSFNWICYFPFNLTIPSIGFN